MNQTAQTFVALPVFPKNIDKIVQLNVPLLKHQLFKDLKAIGRIADSSVVDPVHRIFRASFSIPQTFFNTSFDKHRDQRIRRHMILPAIIKSCLQIIDILIQFDHERLVERFEIGIGQRFVPIELQSPEQRLHHIGRGVDKRRFSGNDCLPTSVVGKFASLLFGVSELDQTVDHHIFVVHRHDSSSETLHLGNPPIELFRCLVANTYGNGVVADMQLLNHIQHQIGQCIGHLFPVSVNSAEYDILIELSVSRSVMFPDPFGSLDPEMSHQFTGFVHRKRSVIQIPFQIGIEHPVKTSNSRPVAHQPEEGIHRPQRLDRLPEITRGILRHMFQRLDNISIELLLLGRCLLLHLLEQLNIPFLPNSSRIQCQQHRLQQVSPVIIQSTPVQPFFYLCPQAFVPRVQHLFETNGRMTDRTHLEQRSYVLRPLAECSRTHDQLSGQNPQRSILSNTHRCIPILHVV